MTLADIIEARSILPCLKVQNKKQLLQEMAQGKNWGPRVWAKALPFRMVACHPLHAFMVCLPDCTTRSHLKALTASL
jgi:hypothetical protein